jgi:hypothetical protein
VKQTLQNEGKPKLGQAPNPETLFEFKINDKVIQYPDPKQPPTDPFKAMINQGIYPSPYVPVPNPFFPNMQNPMYTIRRIIVPGTFSPGTLNKVMQKSFK